MPHETETGGLDASMELAQIGVGADNKNSDSPPLDKDKQVVPFVNQEEATSQIGSTEPVTREISTEADTSKQADQAEQDRKDKRKVIVEFAPCVILFGFSELFCIKFLPIDSLGYVRSVTIAIHGFLTLVSGFVLLIHTLFVLQPENANYIPDPVQYNISNALLIISSASLFLASLAPLSLLPKPYNFLIPIVLVPLFLTLGIYLYLRIPSTNDKTTEKDHTESDEHIKTIMRVFELSQATVSLSSGGLIGLLFGVYKNASNHAHHPLVRVTIFLTFISFMFSTLLMFLCQIHVMNFSSSARKNFLRVAVIFCMSLLVLLVIAAFAISFTFLKWYTIMIFIPVFIVCGIWFHIDWPTRDHQHDRDILPEAEVKLAYTNASKVASLSFGGIMAIYAGYLGTSDDLKNMHLNLCMIFLTSAFISGLSLMLLLSYKAPTRSRIRLVISLLRCFGICLLLFGAFTTFIVEFVQL